MTDWLHNPIVKGALSGWAAAAIVDLHAFRTWKSGSEFKSYDWGTAALRWGQGILSGALTAAGLGFI